MRAELCQPNCRRVKVVFSTAPTAAGMSSVEAIVAGVAATPVMRCCSRCKTQRYANAEEQRLDWPRHKAECHAPPLDLACLWSDAVLELVGPRLIKGKWSVGPGEMALSTCTMDLSSKAIPAAARLPLDQRRFVSHKFAQAHREQHLAYPTEMLCVFSRVFESHELAASSVTDLVECTLALPGNVSLSRADYWSWYSSGKCDMTVAAQMVALGALQRLKGAASLSYRSQAVVAWGSVEVMYTRPFVPVCRAFGWTTDQQGKVAPTDDFDPLTDAAAHRMLFLQCADASVTYVDLTAAQYQAVAHADQAEKMPVLVMHGAKELADHGFARLPGSNPIGNDASGESRLWAMLQADNQHQREGVFVLARQLLDLLAPLAGIAANSPACRAALPLVHAPAWEVLRDAGKSIV
jgi:hypothetical protein